MSSKSTLEARQKIYRSLCYVLSERINQVGWEAFTMADWELFGQMAEREGVAPLMYWKLKDSTVEVSPSTFNYLRSCYYQTLAQNTLMYQELERILKALDEAGIEVIVLKGAALAATVYEDIGLRPMGDLDLLVRREELERALKVLTKVGYQEFETPKLAPWVHNITEYDIRLFKEDQEKMVVELHWNLISGDLDWRSPSLDWFWEKMAYFEVANHLKSQVVTDDRIKSPDSVWRICSLRYDAHLTYLAAHLALQHGNKSARVLWFYDIYLLSAYQLDWDDLLNRAGRYHWEPALRYVLNYLQVHFNRLLPEEVGSTLNDTRGRSFQSTWLVKRKTSWLQTYATKEMDHLISLDFLNGVKYFFALVFPSQSYMAWRYDPKPGWLWPLWYPYRWLRMTYQVLFTLLKLVLDRPQ